jgi:MFS family permease
VTADDRSTRLVTGPFLAVTTVTLLFFVYVGIQAPLIPRLVEDGLGGTELDIGLNLAAFSLAAIAIRPLLGTWGDRSGRRILIVAGGVVAAAASAASTVVDDRWLLLPLRAVAGIGEAALFVGAATLISDFAPPHRRAEAASYFSVAVFGGLGIGPIVGEAAIAGDDFDRGLIVGGLFALGAALGALLIPDDRAHTAALAREAVAATEAGAAPAQRFHRAAILPGMVLAFGVGGFATFNAFVPDHSTTVGLGGSKWVFLTYSVVCLVVRIFGARLPERLGLARSVSTALVLQGVGLFTLAAIATPAGVYAGAAVIGLGTAFMYPALMAMTVNRVPEHERARIISTFTMFFEVGVAGGALLFGFVAEFTGKRGGFLGGGISALVGLWFLWRVLLPALRSRPISASDSEVVAAH